MSKRDRPDAPPLALVTDGPAGRLSPVPRPAGHLELSPFQDCLLAAKDVLEHAQKALPEREYRVLLHVMQMQIRVELRAYGEGTGPA